RRSSSPAKPRETPISPLQSFGGPLAAEVDAALACGREGEDGLLLAPRDGALDLEIPGLLVAIAEAAARGSAHRRSLPALTDSRASPVPCRCGGRRGRRPRRSSRRPRRARRASAPG